MSDIFNLGSCFLEAPSTAGLSAPWIEAESCICILVRGVLNYRMCCTSESLPVGPAPTFGKGTSKGTYRIGSNRPCARTLRYTYCIPYAARCARYGASGG